MLRGRRLRRFQQALVAWYAERARPLRIRTTRDPWAVLVSEVMAQQTQIARVDEAWSAFVRRFPTPRSMALAPTAEVVRAWAGLGYNRRAVNLQRAAARIESEHEGRVPSEPAVLRSLPGVGPYTARAVAAIAFGRPVAPVDTNVRRVVTRLAAREMTPSEVQAAADGLVDRTDPARWTHASMELGATVCLPRRPACGECPVRRWCTSADRVPAAQIVSASPRPGDMPFEQTSRWLRGRIVARLRALDDGEWARLPARLGDHDARAIEAAVAGLERDGLLERHPDGALRLPSETT